MKYLKYLDGLRGLSVIVVILYHANLGIIKGGFIGVDIFFVLSGFLITSIILTQINNNSFSFKNFWAKRIKRILPPLFFMTLLTIMIFGIFYGPISYEKLGTTLISISLFSSNLYFPVEQGNYFSLEKPNPFLHTWSLGVEEQFYIFFPILIYFLHKGKKSIISSFVILFILSFLYSIYLININPNSNYIIFEHFSNLLNTNKNVGFYILLSRMWELLAGSILGYILLKDNISDHYNKYNELINIVGFILIGYGLFFINKTSFPGLHAIYPVLGSVLIIYANYKKSTTIGNLLNNNFLVFIGKISYGLYLYHWPIFVTIYYFYSDSIHLTFIIIIGILLTVLLSIFSYYFIEKPILKSKTSHKKVITIGVIGILVILSIGIAIKFNNGIKERFGEYSYLFDKYTVKSELEKKCRSNKDLCIVGDDSVKKISFVVMGDSHAAAIIDGIDNIAKKYNKKGIFATESSCRFIKNVPENMNNNCLYMKEKVYGMIEKNNIENILFASRWGAIINENNINESEDILKSLKEELSTISYDKNIWIMEQVPILNYPIGDYISKYILSKKYGLSLSLDDIMTKKETFIEKQSQINSVLSKIDTINYIDPKKIICKDGVYCGLHNENSDLIYKDDDHLNEYGAYYIQDLFKPFFKSF